MNIRFTDYHPSDELIELLTTWYNDPDMAGFIHPNFTGADALPLSELDVEKMMRPHPDVQRKIVMDDTLPIGELSITRHFPHLIKNEPKSAWISILIGDKHYWRLGVATSAMRFLEEACRAQGFARIELGVFEHNVKAQGLYHKMGYQIFERIENFTYDKGAWHADLRMEKSLESAERTGE